ncbi:MAG: HEAT repeat domain-containing protein [Planctomycetes bacterium]|nr:HEAT repeat domain-containing protein [Planctomycetota bacterium]
MKPHTILWFVPLAAASLALVCALGAPRSESAPDALSPTLEKALEPAPRGAALRAPHRALADAASAFAATQGRYWAPVGSRFLFELATRTELSAIAREEGAERRSDQTLETRGKLVVEVVARREREALVALHCSELELSKSGASARDAELEQNLQAARALCFARIDADGQILGYRFEEALALPQRDYLRGLYGGFAFVAPREASERWEATGADSAGSFLADYRRLPSEDALFELERVKRSYTAQRDADTMPMRCSGRATARLDEQALGWLVRAELAERTDIAAALVPVEFAIAYQATLKLVSAERGVTWDYAVDFEAVNAAPGGEAEDPSAHRAAQKRAAEAEQLAGYDLARLHAEMRALLEQGQTDSRELMELWQKACALLRHDPALLSEIEGLLRDATLSAELASLWCSVLAHAGTPEAQATLFTAYGDLALSPTLRAAAAAALFDVARPSPELLASLGEHVAGLRALDEASASAFLAYGALLRGDAAHEATLAAWKSRAVELGAEDLWIDALSNARSPQLLAEARAALGDERTHVRVAALRALAQVEGAEALAALRGALEREVDIEARAEAVRALARRAEPDAGELALSTAERDTSPFVRTAAMLALARSGLTPELRTVLARIAANDVDASVRELAARLLS